MIGTRCMPWCELFCCIKVELEQKGDLHTVLLDWHIIEQPDIYMYVYTWYVLYVGT